MNSWRDVWVAQEYRRDQIREADSWRLARLARTSHPRPIRFHYRLLVRFGRQMVYWGQWLQARYAEITLPNETNVSHSEILQS